MTFGSSIFDTIQSIENKEKLNLVAREIKTQNLLVYLEKLTTLSSQGYDCKDDIGQVISKLNEYLLDVIPPAQTSTPVPTLTTTTDPTTSTPAGDGTGTVDSSTTDTNNTIADSGVQS